MPQQKLLRDGRISLLLLFHAMWCFLYWHFWTDRLNDSQNRFMFVWVLKQLFFRCYHWWVEFIGFIFSRLINATHPNQEVSYITFLCSGWVKIWIKALKILWTFEGICDCFGFLIVSLLTLFFAVLLLVGAYKKCHKLVMSWLVAAGIVFSRSNFSWFDLIYSLKNFTC